MEKREEVRRFLSALLRRKGDAAAFADGDSLLLSGRIDSMNVLEIVGFLETEMALDLAEKDFDPNSFDSVDGIIRLLEGKPG
jgi:acyl carrier protein